MNLPQIGFNLLLSMFFFSDIIVKVQKPLSTSEPVLFFIHLKTFYCLYELPQSMVSWPRRPGVHGPNAERGLSSLDWCVQPADGRKTGWSEGARIARKQAPQHHEPHRNAGVVATPAGTEAFITKFIRLVRKMAGGGTRSRAATRPRSLEVWPVRLLLQVKSPHGRQAAAPQTTTVMAKASTAEADERFSEVNHRQLD